MIPLHVFVAMVLGWLQEEQHRVIEYLGEENRVLKAQLRSRRVQLTDHERRRLAVLGASPVWVHEVQQPGQLSQLARTLSPDDRLRSRVSSGFGQPLS